MLERSNPIDYKPTRFDKDRASDGNLLDLATRQAGQALTDMFGKKHHDESRHAGASPNCAANAPATTAPRWIAGCLRHKPI